MARMNWGLLLAAAAVSILAAAPLCHGADCPPGTIDTLAGGGWRTGPAAEVCIGSAAAVAIGPDGSIYIADADESPMTLGNTHLIRKIDPAGTMTVVAGDGWTRDAGGDGRYDGDGGPALEASLDRPSAVAVAPDGSLYIADTGNHRIRKVDPNGVITTVAGDGWMSAYDEEHLEGDGRFGGDGGPAAKASLWSPSDIALAADGSLYIADRGNGRIRKIGPDGIITTAYTQPKTPGEGERRWGGPNRVALGPDGSLYACDGTVVFKIGPGDERTVVAGGGEFSHRLTEGKSAVEAYIGPTDVEVAADGTLYIADGSGFDSEQPGGIRKVAPDGILTTVVEEHHPRGLALAPDGSFYVAAGWLRKIDPAGDVTIVAGGGNCREDGRPATNTVFNNLQSVAVTADGTIYFSEHASPVRRIEPDGTVRTVYGRRPAGDPLAGTRATELPIYGMGPFALGPGGEIYLGYNQGIIKVDAAGIVSRFAGGDERGFRGDGGPALQAGFEEIAALAVGPDGSLHVADKYAYRVRKIDAAGTITTVAGSGLAGRDLEGQVESTGDGGPATEATLLPVDFAMAPDGSVYIVDAAHYRGLVRRLAPDGTITTVTGGGRLPPHLVDGGPAARASLDRPRAIAFGPEGSLYILETADRGGRVRKVTPAGVITTIAGTGYGGFSGDGGPALEAEFQEPEDLAVGPDGSVYIADSENRRVRKVDAAGIITTIAGGGERARSAEGPLPGEGGPAVEAPLGSPGQVEVGPDGSIYIADYGHVRKVDPAGMITTVVGDTRPSEERYADMEDGPAAEGRLCVWSLSGTPDGTLYLTTPYGIRVIGTDGMITTIAGGKPRWRGGSVESGLAEEASFNHPGPVAVGPDGSVYVPDEWNHRIRKVTPDGKIAAIAGSGPTGEEEGGGFGGDGGPAIEARLTFPSSVAVGPDGAIYVADTGNHRIRRVDAAGIITTVVGDGFTEQLKTRWGSVAAGRFAGDGGPAAAASLNFPNFVAFGRDGSMYVIDAGNERVRKVDTKGIITTIAGDGWEDPESRRGRLRGDGGPAVEASLNDPVALAVGPDGTVYVAENGNERIRRICP